METTKTTERDLFNAKDLRTTDPDIFDKRIWEAFDNDQEPCMICGRVIAEGKGWEVRGYQSNSWFLAVSEWEVVATEDRGSDMGITKIGPECGKKIPAAYKRKAEA